MSSLSMRQVSHNFGSIPVLTAVDLECAERQRVAIVGPSGSGKSTLLGILGGLVRPTKGTVEVLGTDERTAQESVAWVLQASTALRRRDVLDNVMLGPLGDGCQVRIARVRALQAVAEVGLSELSGRSARSLSSGELQRVSIARAFASLRSFVLADEPTAHLDQTTSIEVASYLLDARQSRGIVIATHDLRLASMCDVIWRLEGGTLRESKLENR